MLSNVDERNFCIWLESFYIVRKIPLCATSRLAGSFTVTIISHIDRNWAIDISSSPRLSLHGFNIQKVPETCESLALRRENQYLIPFPSPKNRHTKRILQITHSLLTPIPRSNPRLLPESESPSLPQIFFCRSCSSLRPQDLLCVLHLPLPQGFSKEVCREIHQLLLKIARRRGMPRVTLRRGSRDGPAARGGAGGAHRCFRCRCRENSLPVRGVKGLTLQVCHPRRRK